MSGKFDWEKVIQSQPDGTEPPESAPAPQAGETWEALLSQVPDKSSNAVNQEVSAAEMAAPAPTASAEPVAEAPMTEESFGYSEPPVVEAPPVYEQSAPVEYAEAPPVAYEVAAEAPTYAEELPVTEVESVQVLPPPVFEAAPVAAWHEEPPKAPPAEATPYEAEPETAIELPKPPPATRLQSFSVVAGSPVGGSLDAEITADNRRIQSINTASEVGATKYELYDESSRVLVNEPENAAPLDGVHLDDILRMAVERRASDIHFTVGLPPMIRLDGEMVPLPWKILKPVDTRRLLTEILTDDNLQKFESTHELDFSHSVRDAGRFRVNVYMQRGVVASAIRSIPTKIPSFADLGLPDAIRDMCKRSSGLILVTGPTGSGKSTTIATMLDDLNDHRAGHIMTIEDPIEYLHMHKKCMVNQRELHADTYSFHNALRAVLREDPDIILVGELRDLETIEAALTLAETGHLVFGTLHTRNAPATIDRIIDVFPSDQQGQIRVLLGNTLEGVISQQLLPKIGGGRIAAHEIMLGIPAVRNLIREGKTHQMYSIIETGRQHGMVTLDSSLAYMYKRGICTYDECMIRAVDKDNFAKLAKSAA